MNMLPIGLLILFLIILVLLSSILFVQLYYRNVKAWAKKSATCISIVLILIYTVGIAYGLGTVSFMDKITNKNNPNAVSVDEEPFNVLITGIDTDGTIDELGRSDVNMLVTVNPNTGRVLLTSIPRDYEVRLPEFDYATDKLTHSGFYGTDVTIGAVEDLLDIKINYYIKVNFTTVKQFVDAIGGIDVYSEYEFNPVKMKDWTVQEGMNHMSGPQALAFARERKAFATGDHQRIKNQQAVMEALIKKATSGITMIFKYNHILRSLRDYVEMNASSREVRGLIKVQLFKGVKWDIEKYSLTGDDDSMPTYSTGDEATYVMRQDESSINDARAKIAAVIEKNE